MNGAHPARWRRGELGYCSNVHAGESVAELQDNLTRYQQPIRIARGLESMGAGLWLARRAVAALREEKALLHSFRESLLQAGIELFTLNGFPIGGFHDSRVKEQVYRPTWADPERRLYTLALAEILAACLPNGLAEGTISTLPLGQAAGWSAQLQRAALGQLCVLVGDLDRIRQEHGRTIRVCLEMEPGCVLERTDAMLRLFRDELPPVAAESGVRAELLGRHLGVCFDVCHQAVMFEDAFESLQRLHEAGIVVGKIQLSSAVEVADPGSPSIRDALAQFAEPRYLHQVRAPDGVGGTVDAMDLPEALASSRFARAAPWRIHFHVPVHAATLVDEQLATTRDAIGRTLDFLKEYPDVSPHLEVETYTWHVLPDELRPRDDEGMRGALVRELQWVENAMDERGLLA